MRLDARARAVGRKVGDRVWIVSLRNLVDGAPWALADVQVETDASGDLVVTLGPELLSEQRTEWWRELEVQLRTFVPLAEPEEAEIVAGVVERLAWHPRKPRLQRRLEERAFGYAMPPEACFATPEPVLTRASG
jgi:hypothetical protein